MALQRLSFWEQGGAGLAAVAWTLACLAWWAPLWQAHTSSVRDAGALLAAGAWLPYLHLAVFSAVLLLSRGRDGRPRAGLLLAFQVLSLVAFVLAAGRQDTALAALVPSAWLALGGAGVRAAWSKALVRDLPLWAAALLFLVIVEGVVLAAAALGLATFAGKAGLGALLTAAAAVALARWRPQPGRLLAAAREIDAAGWLLLEGILLFACLAFLHAATPETLVDSTALHLLKAKALARSPGLGGLVEFPYNSFYLLPSYLHLLFGYFHTFLGDWGVKGLTWALFPLGAWLVHDLARAAGAGRNGALGAALLFVSVPGFLWHYGCGYIDLPAGLLGLAGLVMLARWLHGDRGRLDLVLAGVLLAAGASAKLHMGLFLVAATLAFAGAAAATKGARRTAAALVPFLLGGALVLGPHLVLEYSVTGNPVFPALNGIFHSPFWNEALTSQASLERSIRLSLLDWLRFPYLLTARTSLFGSAMENVDGSAGVYALLVFPLALWGAIRERCRPAVHLAWVTAAIYLGGLALLGVYSLRYFIPLLGLVFALAGRGASGAVPFRLKVAAGLALVALAPPQLLFPTVWSPGVDRWQAYRTGNHQAFLEREFPGYGEILRLVQDLPGGARVLGYHYNAASHLPRPTVFFRTSDMIFNGPFGLRPRPAARTLMEQDFFVFLGRFNAGDQVADFDQRLLAEVLREFGDLLVVSRLDNIEFLRRRGLVTLDRMLSAPGGLGGTGFTRTAAFGNNDALFPPAAGVRVTFPGPAGNPTGWMFRTLEGKLAPPAEPGDVWAANERFLQRAIAVPAGARTLRMILDLGYGPQPDLAPGVQIDWFDAESKLVYSYPLGIIYNAQAAAVYAVVDVPADARALSLVIRPNAGRCITASGGEMLFTAAAGSQRE